MPYTPSRSRSVQPAPQAVHAVWDPSWPIHPADPTLLPCAKLPAAKIPSLSKNNRPGRRRSSVSSTGSQSGLLKRNKDSGCLNWVHEQKSEPRDAKADQEATKLRSHSSSCSSVSLLTHDSTTTPPNFFDHSAVPCNIPRIPDARKTSKPSAIQSALEATVEDDYPPLTFVNYG